MKKVITGILAVLFVTGYFGCNNDKKEEATDSTIVSTPDSLTTASQKKKKVKIASGCEGSGNLTIEEEEANTMKKDYVKYYVNTQTTGKRLSQDVWIDKNVIRAFAVLFEKEKKIDGVRFINAVKSKDDETTLIMVPTLPRTIKDTTKSDHVNSWKPITLQSGEVSRYKHFGLKEDEANRMTKLFKDLYLTKPSDETYCLSESIWMDTCVIKELDRLLQNSDYITDGIRVWFGAYSDRRYQNPSQKSEKQSTIIIVPTYEYGTEHRDDWKIIQGHDINKEKDFAGYNHGQLCPQICD